MITIKDRQMRAMADGPLRDLAARIAVEIAAETGARADEALRGRVAAILRRARDEFGFYRHDALRAVIALCRVHGEAALQDPAVARALIDASAGETTRAAEARAAADRVFAAGGEAGRGGESGA